MDDVALLVKILQSLSKLPDNLLGERLFDTAHPSAEGTEVSAVAVFEHQTEVLGRPVILVQLYNILVRGL